MNVEDIVYARYKSVLFIDFETRSKADLLSLGAHRYCMDDSTRMLLCSYAFDDCEVVVTDELPKEVIDAIQDPNVLKVAHNAEFDMSVIKYVLGITIDIDEWFDTAYQGVYYGLPRKLSELAKRLQIEQKDEQTGVYFFSIPRKKSKAELLPSLFNNNVSDFNEPEDYPQEWEEFKRYAIKDTIVMRQAFRAMAMLPAIEIFTSQMTMKMNFNGVPFDAKLAVKIYRRAMEYEKNASEKALELYGIENLKSTQQVQKALRANEVYLDSLNKKTRLDTTHEILDLRDVATGAAFSKIPTALTRMCSDGRLHGEFIGHGAHTGRWSSKGVQLQNWARINEPVSELMEDIKSYDHLRQHMRLCLGNTVNKEFTCADLSQIEARITAWMAGSAWRMEAFANDVDIYARSAEKMFNKEHVSKNDIERYYGKCAELGFGYGGGHQAIKNIQPMFYEEVGEAKVRELVDRWRAANPEISRLWRTLEQTLRASMRTGRQQVICGGAKLTFMYDGKHAKIILPSGRALYYRSLHTSATDRGSSELAYMDYSRGGNAIRVRIWGGVLLENVVQAISRDILVDIMQRVEQRLPDAECIGTVHDEVWYLNSPNVDTFGILLEEMARPISWAYGLVTKGDGFTSDRYRK